MHDIDGDIQLLQVLFESTMVVPCTLHEHENLFKGNVISHALDQHAKPLTRIVKDEGWTGFKALMTIQQGLGEEACNVFGFANVHPDVQRLIGEHRNHSEVWMLVFCWVSHCSWLLECKQVNASAIFF